MILTRTRMQTNEMAVGTGTLLHVARWTIFSTIGQPFTRKILQRFWPRR